MFDDQIKGNQNHKNASGFAIMQSKLSDSNESEDSSKNQDFCLLRHSSTFCLMMESIH